MNFGTLKSPYLYSEMLMTMTCFQSWELGVQRWQLEVFPEHKKTLKTREKRMKFKDRKRNCPFSSPIICQTLWYDIMQGRKKNHRSTGWGRKGLLEDIWSDHPAQARPPRAGCPGAYPDSFCIFPKREKPQCLWATFASAPSPSQLKTVSWCSDRRSCVALCARWLLSHHWTPLERV